MLATSHVPRARAESSDLVEHRFRAMSTEVRVFITDPGAGAHLRAVEMLFAEFEARFSRFLPGSELARLNACASEEVPVSVEMRELLRASLDLHRRTGGLFDPAVLPQLERAGYDRSFEQVAANAPAATSPVAPGGQFARVSLSTAGDGARLPAGMRIDFGGIGKGYTVDAAARMLTERGVRSFLIDAGGDIAARGDGPGGGWAVAVADPCGDGDIDVVRLRDRAIATSSAARRRWLRGGVAMHHIIDPRTGAPAASGLLAATVLAATATEADVFAKAALLAGETPALALLAAQHAEGLLVRDDGSWVTTRGWPGEG